MSKLISPKDEKEFRSNLERKQNAFFSGIEKLHYKDSLHYLRGGLDQVLLKIANRRKHTIVFSMDSLKKQQDPIKQARLLARMQSNMWLSKKFKVNTKVIGSRAFERFLNKRN